jgi:hypothetical protein
VILLGERALDWEARFTESRWLTSEVSTFFCEAAIGNCLDNARRWGARTGPRSPSYAFRRESMGVAQAQSNERVDDDK